MFKGWMNYKRNSVHYPLDKVIRSLNNRGQKGKCTMEGVHFDTNIASPAVKFHVNLLVAEMRDLYGAHLNDPKLVGVVPNHRKQEVPQWNNDCTFNILNCN